MSRDRSKFHLSKGWGWCSAMGNTLDESQDHGLEVPTSALVFGRGVDNMERSWGNLGFNGMRMVSKRTRKPSLKKRGGGKPVLAGEVDVESVGISGLFLALNPRVRISITALVLLSGCYFIFSDFSDVGGGTMAPEGHIMTPDGFDPPAKKSETSLADRGNANKQKENSLSANTQEESSEVSSKDPPAQDTESVENMRLGDRKTSEGFGNPVGNDYVWNNGNGLATTQSCFSFGEKNDHACSFGPLCLNTQSLELVIFQGEQSCSGSKRGSDWFAKMCPSMRNDLIKESGFPSISEKPRAWLEDPAVSSRTTWVEGTTMLQMLELSCGNIAHYGGRIFFAHHILSNPSAYLTEGSTIDNYLLFPGADVMKRFEHPERYANWHDTVFQAVVYPSKPQITTLDQFTEAVKTENSAGMKTFILHDQRSKEDQLLCFRRAIIPGFLKGRYFIYDGEFPSLEPSAMLFSGSPILPRDSVKFRAKVNQVLRGQLALTYPSRRVVFLDRAMAAVARRAVEPSSKEKLFHLIQRKAAENKFDFKAIAFDGLDFKEQEALMRNTALAIGVHGANLVNAIFQPAFSVLIELMPYQFDHPMYIEGGRAGVKYFKHQMQTGEEYPKKDSFPSTAECIRTDHDCKVHYRDQALRLASEDLEAISKILDASFSYLKNAEHDGHLSFDK